MFSGYETQISSEQNAGIVIKHISNARKISVRPFASSSPEAPLRPQNPQFLLSLSKSVTGNQTLKIPRYPTSPSATFIGQNEDLLTQILLGLPPKSLLRFQCVSKKWLSIISGTYFRRLHCRRYSTTSSFTPSALFLTKRTEEARELNFVSFREEDVNSIPTLTSRLRNFLSDEKVWKLHSCNGLFCIDFNCNLNSADDELIVYNPTTDQSRLIPWPQENCYFRASHIAFDPVKSDNYKILCVWSSSDDPEKLRFLLYSSETGSWTHAKESIDLPFTEPFYINRGVLWNGDFHWYGANGSTVCFDLDNECLRTRMPCVPFPMSFNDEWNISYFGESGGNLQIIRLNDPQALLFDVFELERDYSKWVLKYRIDFAPLTLLYPSMLASKYDPFLGCPCPFYIPYLLVDEKICEARVMVSLVGMLISYDIKRMTVKDLAEVLPMDVIYDGESISKYRWFDVYQHIETLAVI